MLTDPTNNDGTERGKLDARVAQLSDAKRTLLEKWLRGTGKGSGDGVPPRDRSLPSLPLPASFAQQRFWFIERFSPGNVFYHLPLAFRLRGPLDTELLAKALDVVAMRHEILRTTFALQAESLTQVVAAASALKVAVDDLGHLNASSEGQENELRRRMEVEIVRPFDLARDPLCRARVFRLGEREGENEYVFLLTLHHVIADGWSLAILINELTASYRALAKGGAQAQLPLPPLPIQYGDYAVWQANSIAGPRLAVLLDRWNEILAGAPPEIDLPIDRPRRETAYRGSQHKLALPDALGEQLATASTALDATPFGILLAALAAVLSRWTAQTDMVIGTVGAGRSRQELESLIGCFINFLPLRIRASGSDGLADLIRRVGEVNATAHDIQDCPFERIVERINPDRTSGRNPIFNVGFLYQSFPVDVPALSGAITAQPFHLDQNTTTLDLRFLAETIGQKWFVTCEYDADLFEWATIDALLSAFAVTLEALLDEPERRVDTLLLPDRLAQSATSRRRLPITIASTFTTEPLQEPLEFWLDLIGYRASITFAGPNQVFQQLLNPTSTLRATKGGAALLPIRLQDWTGNSAATDGDPIGCTSRSFDSEELYRNVAEFVRALASACGDVAWTVVLSCPSALELASDPDYARHLSEAENRLFEGIRTLPNVLAVNTATLRQLYPVGNTARPYAEALAGIPYSDDLFAALAAASVRRLYSALGAPWKVIAVDCDDTLWSGVCGEDAPETLGLLPHHRALQSVLVAQHDQGMLLCLCSRNDPADVEVAFARRRDFPLRPEHIVARRINWDAKSKNLQALAAELRLGLDSFIFIDNSPIECAEVAGACPSVLTVNLPTDGARWPNVLQNLWPFDHMRTTAESGLRTRLYAQDRERERALAQALSHEEFLAGLGLEVDMASVQPEQLDRISELTFRTNQFNLSGRRRSTAELAALMADGIHHCMAISVRDRFGSYGLTGVVIYRRASAALLLDTFLLSCRVLGREVEYRVLYRLAEIAEEMGFSEIEAPLCETTKNLPLRAFLKAAGTSYCSITTDGMTIRLPLAVARAMPRVRPVASAPAATTAVLPAESERSRQETAGLARIAIELGEIGRVREAMRARAAAESGKGVPERRKQDYCAPRTEVERRLAELWMEVLHLERIGIHDSFFDVGGHSLRAVVVLEQVREAFGVELSLATFFHGPTIEECAANIEATRAERAGRELTGTNGGAEAIRVAVTKGAAEHHPALFELQPHGHKLPFFCVHPVHGHVLCYATLARALGRDRPVYGLRSLGMDGKREPVRSIEGMASEYCAAIRSVQPTGPYLIGGWSMGTAVALETARALQAAGEKVGLLVLFDDVTLMNDADGDADLWFLLALCQEKLLPFERIWYLLPSFAEGILGFLAEYEQMTAEEQLHRVAEEAIEMGVFPANMTLARAIAFLDVMRSNMRALASYQPQPYAGRVLTLRASEEPWYFSVGKPDGIFVSPPEIYSVPGSHFTLLSQPHVQTVAKLLANCLDAVDSTFRSRIVA